MSRKQKKSKQRCTPLVQIPGNFSQEDWTHIIADAIVEAEEKRRVLIEKEQAKNLQEWRDTLGIREYPSSHKIIKLLLEQRDALRLFVRLPFIPAAKIKDPRISVNIFGMLLSLLFYFGYMLFLFGGISLMFAGLIYFLIIRAPVRAAYSVLIGFLFYILSGILRTARIEIEKMKDKNLLLTIFMCVMSVVAVIVAIAAKSA